MVFGHWSGDGGLMTLKCFRCGGAFKMGAADFNRLSSLTNEERVQLGYPPIESQPQEQGGTTPPLE